MTTHTGTAVIGEQVPHTRGAFHSLIAANPNYFGTSPDLDFEMVEPISVEASFEGIDCVAYSAKRDRLEATISVRRSFGYGGGPCTAGSVEHLRFYLDDGNGWQDVGPAGINVHDFAEGKDCPGNPVHPLSYTAGVAYSPRRRWCGTPLLPRVRVILSWGLVPPPGQPDWKPVWGDVHECAVQIAPRRFFFGDILEFLPAKVLDILPAKVLDQVPVPGPDPDPGPVLPLAELVKKYADAEVPQHRLALPSFVAVASSAALQVSTTIESATLAKSAGIDLGSVFQAIEQTSGDVSYEELECLGLDAGLSSLVATYRVKRPSGFSGGPCTAGSTEYVAFWADWDDDCSLQYLGTVQTSAHDYELPDGGLCYAAIQPVDLGELRRPCDQPMLRRVRAVLSWGAPPSITDPDAVPTWGNRIDRHVQVEPGPAYDGTAKFTIVGGVAAQDVDLVTGLTAPGAVLGTSTVPLSPSSCPFAGLVTLQGPTDPALVGHQYRVRATNVGVGGSSYLTQPFSVVTAGGVSAQVVPDPVTGWAPWPTWSANTEGTLGVHTPGGDDRWDYHLELDAAGNDVAVARVQQDNTVRNQVLAGDPVNAGGLELFTGDACRQEHGPLKGHFVALDRHFSSWSITVLGGPGGPIPPIPLTVDGGLTSTQQTPPGGTDFELDLSDPHIAPCGYVVRATIVDRAVVNSAYQGQHTTIDRGICLE
jgi:hypothetical protein